MPDTLSREDIDFIRKRMDVWSDYGPDPTATITKLLAHIDALTAAVEKLPLYDENARTMADAAESMRNRVLAILRGES